MTRIERTRFATKAGTALALSLLAATSLTLSNPALAETSANIKSMTFTTQPNLTQEIVVSSSNNQKWDTIDMAIYSIGMHVNIDTRHPGWVRHVGIVLGACGGAACLGKPLLWSASPVQRDYEKQKVISFPTSKIPVSTTGIATVPYGDQIVAACNAKLAPVGGGDHTFNWMMPVTFVADTFKSIGSQNNPYAEGQVPPQLTFSADHATTSYVATKVKCKGFERSRDIGDVAAEQPKNLNVNAIALFRSTYSHATTQPNPGTVCKKARWLVRLDTNKAGPVKFKLWTKIGDGPTTSKVIDAWSSFDGNSKYQAEYSEWTEVTKTTNVQAMAEDMTNPIGQSTGWKDITLRCEGAAGGGFADVPNNANPDNGSGVAPLKATGELALADKAGAPKDKPRLGQAVFKIWMNKPGATSYKLTCSGGRQWNGTLSTFKVGQHKYQAVGAHNFQIAKTEQIGCALRVTSLPKDDVVAVATKMFELVKRNPNLGGPDTVSAKPRPQPTLNRGATQSRAQAVKPAQGRIVRPALRRPANSAR